MDHTIHVSQCWNYSTGTCMFGEMDCWFIHKGQSSVPEFKCKICDEQYFNRTELQQHRKNIHPHTIPPCRNIMNGGKCLFDKHCLSKHVEIETSNVVNIEETESEVLYKIFNFMEKVTEKIDRLERKEILKEN